MNSIAAKAPSSLNVISYYPLTDNLRRQIEGALSAPADFVAIGRLRSLGLPALFRRIRELKADRILVAIENDNSRPLAGPLVMVAALSGTRHVAIRWPDGRTEEIPRGRILVDLWHMARAQVTGRLAVRKAAAELRRLVDSPAAGSLKADMSRQSVVYLDANLSFGLAAGGSVGHVKGVIDALVRRGSAVDYVSCKPRPTETANWLNLPPPDLYAFPPEINCYLFNEGYQRFLAKLAGENRHSFIYQRMSVHNYSGAWLRCRTGTPLVLEFNGSEVWVAANWNAPLRLEGIARRAEAASILNADLLVTVSKVLGDQLAETGVPRERIVVYPNCIDAAIFDPARFSPEDNDALRRRLGIAADATVATFIGTFGMWHGVDFLARCIRRLATAEADWIAAHRLHFLLVGDGLKMPEVAEILAPAEIARHVTLTGLVPQAQAPAYLALSDIFLSPHVPNPDGTPFFGSPTKLFEYMAMGKPIVAADLDQIGAVLRGTYLDEEPTPAEPLAELFPPGDENAFIAALRRVVETPDAARATGTRAREAALRLYTWDKHVDAILARMQTLGLAIG